MITFLHRSDLCYIHAMNEITINGTVSHSLEETQDIAKRWLLDISKKYADNKRATVIGLSGNLGAGKTAFVKAVARALNIEETVTSPTFVIMKIYEIRSSVAENGGETVDGKNWKRLVHIDLYRLEKKEELKALNLEDVVNDPNNLVMVEWPENVGFETDELIRFS